MRNRRALERDRERLSLPGFFRRRPPSGATTEFNPLSLFGQYNAAGLYIPDFTPTRLSASGLHRLWQFQLAPGTQTTAVAQTIATVIGEDQGAALGTELIPTADGDGSSFDNWTGNDAQALLSIVSGTFKVENGDASEAYAAFALTGLTIGAVYKLTYTNVEFSGATQAKVGAVADASIVGQTASTVAGGANLGEGAVLLVPSATDISIRLGPSSTTSGHFVRFDNVSLRQLMGNHAAQTTTANRGTLRQGNANSRYCWRGDGTNDCLLTTLAPTASLTLICGVEFDAVSDKCIGASVGTNLISLGTDSNGLATAYVGSSVIALSAADVRDIPGVIAISVSGTSYYGIWKPFTASAIETVSGTFSGSIPTTQNLWIGAENDDGAAATPHAGDNYFDFAIQAQLTAAEIASVAGYASRPLA